MSKLLRVFFSTILVMNLTYCETSSRKSTDLSSSTQRGQANSPIAQTKTSQVIGKWGSHSFSDSINLTTNLYLQENGSFLLTRMVGVGYSLSGIVNCSYFGNYSVSAETIYLIYNGGECRRGKKRPEPIYSCKMKIRGSVLEPIDVPCFVGKFSRI